MPNISNGIVAQKPQPAQFSAAELQTYMTGQRLTDALNFLESRGITGETALFILGQAKHCCIGCAAHWVGGEA